MKLLKFSENLKVALAVNNKTQKELAEQVGTTQQAVSRWLSGINEPDFTTLLKSVFSLMKRPIHF